jgi:hypothetical protein
MESLPQQRPLSALKTEYSNHVNILTTDDDLYLEFCVLDFFSGANEIEVTPSGVSGERPKPIPVNLSKVAKPVSRIVINKVHAQKFLNALISNLPKDIAG